MGHVHLHVGDVATALRFFAEGLGFDRTVGGFMRQSDSTKGQMVCPGLTTRHVPEHGAQAKTVKT